MSQSPHLPHAASSASNESDRNNQHRKQVSAVIHTNAVGLTSTLFTVFTKLNLGATVGPPNDTSTPALFEVQRGSAGRQVSRRRSGVGELVDSSGPLSKVTLIETTQQLKRQQSLGQFKEADLDNLAELSVGASATTEMIKKAVKDAWSQLTSYIKEKHIDVTYKGASHSFEISTKTTDDLRAAIHQKFHLNATIRCLYHITKSGARAQATEIGDFIDRTEYHLLTAIDQDEVMDSDTAKLTPKFTDMETFFATLKDDQELEPDEIEAIRAVFLTQRIKFKHLMAVGDMSISDEKLEKSAI
ncbi:hypothetical protein BJ741DRAFT_573720 [Chytriomyces cf. hyalinus JEL632]|nr:hypothetical protein BJ741DRAFT_573720 [Chytriomyces cf. hyalinus JEL632]